MTPEPNLDASEGGQGPGGQPAGPVGSNSNQRLPQIWADGHRPGFYCPHIFS